ncbi:MAG: hypothetical protein JSU63_06360 [Phycisphaerales bacterium]|nr:MAG: hypothetical protein JSU63_06360 [Phycisphaerales bacterium]
MLAVSNEATYIAKLSPDELEGVAAAILVEGAPADTRPSDARKIPHKKKIIIVGDEKKRKIEIRHQSLRAAVTSYGVANFELPLPDDDVFREVLESLRDHLGPKAKHKRKVFTPRRATVAPIVLAGVVAVVTWILAGGLGDMKDFKPTGCHRALEELLVRVINVLGSSGVIAVGVLAILGCAWWGYVRYRNPPITVTVRPK